MAPVSKKVLTQALWNTVCVNVRFANDGIHLDVDEDLAPSDLSVYMAQAQKKALAATKSSLETVSAQRKGDRPLAKREAELRSWGISQLWFRPHRIKISRSRVTHFHFHTQNEHWQFDHPGFYLEADYDPAIGTFTEPQIENWGRKVSTTFLPNGPATEFKYNLRLVTTAWNGLATDGHAIIIIDPVFETSKL